ncbi:acetyl-CoA C-acyltransferase family protein [Paraburkholderia sacchari]|uniref:acetyl-CoA C-acyltransferase family protein n=1 Tax=Paraburkholderia sacchari TaxID=159450 RepID=UPI000544197A|nr:acetyl-CoA C-acyltransferase family protein [Paraburkholderia sacchari]NLP64898.1 acetyl-CoA C-acyltransferase family protein [Paraburkholderia sacchari]
MAQREVVVLGVARSAIGTFGGALKDVPMRQLGTAVVRASLVRSGVAADDIGHVVVGNVVPTEPADAYLSRVVAVDSGIPEKAPAFNVNRLCGADLQAIISASQTILLGDTDFAIGGGAESMSLGTYLVPAARWGQRMGDAALIDYMSGILHDPWRRVHMGVTAENVAERFQISREMQDELALKSQQRASRAVADGLFKDEIVPIEIETRKGKVVFDTDEHVRADVTLDALSRMKPVFKRDGGTVTAGNASGINDGAAAVVLGDMQRATEQGLMPLARLVGYAHVGVSPEYMGVGPVASTRPLMERTGLKLADIEVVEADEAFAAQACAVMQQLDLDPERVNMHGSGISLGYSVGATGAILVVEAVSELQRTGARYALVTMCIGGGQGISAVFERL